MSKGTYEIYKPQGANANDSTWKSFTCTLLIFLIICLIILLVSWPWKHSHGHEEDRISTEKLHRDNDTEGLHSGHPTEDKFAKIVHTTTRTTALLENSDYDKGHQNDNHEHEDTTKKNIKDIENYDFENENDDQDENSVTPLYKNENTTDTSIKDEDHNDTEIIRVNISTIEKNSKMIQSFTTTPNENDFTTEIPIYVHHKSYWTDHHATEKNEENEEATDISWKNTDLSHNTEDNHSSSPSIEDETTTTKKIDFIESPTTSKDYTEQILTNSSRRILSNEFAEGTTSKTTSVYSNGFTFENQTFLDCQSLLKDKETCKTTGCKVIASKMVSLMNSDINPCDDFYTYACDGIRQPYLIEDDLSLDVSKRITNSLNKDDKNEDYIKQFKTFLASCVTYDYRKTDDSVRTILNSVGSFHDNTSTSEIPNITVLITQMLKNNYVVLFDININVDKSTGKLGLVIEPTMRESSLKNMFGDSYYDKRCFEIIKVNRGPYNLTKSYQQYKQCQADKSHYLKTVKESLRALHIFNTGNSDSAIEEVMISLKEILEIIDKLRLNNDDGSKKLITPSRLSNSVLCERLKQIDWNYIFKNLLGQDLSMDSYIQVYHAEYLDDLFRKFDKLDPRQLNNGLLAMYAHQLYRDYILDQKISCSRQPYCLELSSKLMEDVSSTLYLDSFKMKSINEFDKRSNEIFNDLKSTLVAEIKSGNWLADATDVNKAIDKLNIVQLISIAKNMPWQDRKFVSNRFIEITLDENNFVENAHELQKRYRRHMYDSYGNDPKLPENIWTFFSLPYDTKMKTNIDLDLIVLPLAITSRNTIPKDIPKYLLMSDFGYQLAQELVVYLQSYGIKILDPTYNANPTVPVSVDRTIDGEVETFLMNLAADHFIKERLPNIAGAKLAYYTYKKDAEKLSTDLPLVWTNKSIDELFFLHMAQQFCSKSTLFDDLVPLYEETKLPAIIKVNSIAMNYAQFPEVFNCTVINPMPAGIKLPQNSNDYEYPYNANDSK